MRFVTDDMNDCFFFLIENQCRFSSVDNKSLFIPSLPQNPRIHLHP